MPEVRKIKKDRAKKIIEYTTATSAVLSTAFFLFKVYRELKSLLS